MYKLNYVEFYITNVCNLNCPNCNRFNNFNFTGHQRWADYADMYKEWSHILEFNSIGILGGEPLLNPDFLEWVAGVANLWPHTKINIITNGTQFDRWPELYDLLASYKGRISLEVSQHVYEENKQSRQRVIDFLQQPVNKKFFNRRDSNHTVWRHCYNNVRDPSWPDCNTPDEFALLPEWIQHECRTVFNVDPDIWNDEIYSTIYTDTNNIEVSYGLANSFNNTTLNYNDSSGKLLLNKSDPAKAIEVCYVRRCHHFIRGKLYKCGPVGVLPEFIKQFNVDITSDEEKLLTAYQPAEPSWGNEDMTKFIKNLTDIEPIPQCTFCPETFIPKKFNSSTKKIKLVKKQW
jgi:organic radical activating enzyme